MLLLTGACSFINDDTMIRPHSNMDSRSSPTDRSVPYTGPYRATKLWNEVIVTFRNGMPLGRHRRYMKTYDNCFSSSEAVDWLHDYLKSNKNFGADVTRSQTIQLLQKLHRARVVEDIRGGKHNRADVCDNNRLFRFVHASPHRQVHARTPLTNRHDLINKDQGPITLDLDHEKPAQMSPIKVLPDCHLVAKQLNAADVEDAWKNMTLDRLQEVLGIEDMSEILDSNFVNGKHVMHNYLYINKSGIVTNIEPKDQLPHWALSAMKCLAHWPEKVDDNLPSYPGFEKDVFRVVRDYFCGLSEPLLTYEMYEVILNVFVTAEGLIQEDCDNESDIPEEMHSPNQRSISSFESVENLLMDLTSVGSTPDVKSGNGLPRVSSTSVLELSPIYPDHVFEQKRRKSTSSLTTPVAAKYETAFGPENRTVTRVYLNKGGVQTEYGYTNGPEELSKTPIETHFKSAQEVPPYVSNSEHCYDSYDINFAHVRSMRKKKSEPCKNAIDKYRRQSSSENNPPHCNNKPESIKSNQYTKNKHYLPARRSYSDSSSQSEINRPAPEYVSPPAYHSLFPDGYKPVIDGRASRKLLNRSISSQALHMLRALSFEDEECQHGLNHQTYTGTQTLGRMKGRRSLDNMCSHGSQTLNRRPSQGALNKCQNSQLDLQSQGSLNSCTDKLHRMASKESLTGRSLSLSDLMHAESKTNLRRACSDAGQVENIIERIKKSLQLVFLLVPPPNRRKLHLLLKLMNKMFNNTKLQLDSEQNTRTLLLETFYRSILSCQDEADMEDLLVMRIVSFLIDHGVDIMLVPKDLKSAVEEKLANMTKTQVSKEDYEVQRMSSSQKALEDLLEEIINDRTMSAARRKQRLKKFEKTYPDIFAKKFATFEQKKDVKEDKPKIKQPLLIRPLMTKLRGLRI
ncbi:DEP domain-containing protein 1A-like isoform X2 [Mytilus edulis]|uniref:DEP domain-containing protein 1A-like isoform X2 n=1 Tax=Mytilus edulis TaxID=6550 RepID=UPI0039EF9926